jgi:hypothetical protein
MGFRHAAALSIAGWFLMTAPLSNQGTVVDQSAPLSEWKKARHFASEQECDAERQENINDSQDEMELAPNSEIDSSKGEANVALSAAMASQCIADNDPRIANTNGNALSPGLLRKLLR